MNQTTSYWETQRFRQWWMKLVILVGVIGAIIIESYVMSQIFIDPGPGGLAELLLFQGLMLVLSVSSLFLYLFRLDTKVENHGLHVKFRPLHRRCRVFQFDDIQSCEAVAIPAPP